MTAVTINTIVPDVRAALEPHPAVREVRLIGSQARGDAGPLSDWDFEVVTNNFDSLAEDIEAVTAELSPLVGQWDRLSPHMCYMLIVPGPVKIDFLFLDQPHEMEPPWVANADMLTAIDGHFWDWTIWLASKDAAGRRELVSEEFRKMSEHILAPMGIAVIPATLITAVELYTEARARLEKEFGVHVERELGNEVCRFLRKHGYDL